MFIHGACWFWFTEPLHAGCATSSLSILVRVLDIARTHCWSNASLDAMFEVVQSEMLPPNNTWPQSHQRAMRSLSAFNFSASITKHICPKGNCCALSTSPTRQQVMFPLWIVQLFSVLGLGGKTTNLKLAHSKLLI
jgi:hypothetical protein